MRTRTPGVVAVLVAVAVLGAPASAQQPAREDPKGQSQEQQQNDKRQGKEQEKQRKEQEKQQEKQRKEHERQQQQDQQRQQQQRQQEQQRVQAQQRVEQRQGQQRAQEQQAQQRSHEQRFAEYDRQGRDQQRLARQRQQSLHQQQRMAQYGVQQQYLERLSQDQLRLRNARPFDYSPYTYRYSRGGRFHQANQYGADMLQRAVNLGYEEGVRAGQSDRDDRWRFDSRNAYAYQDATYGYDGYYVDLNEYRYYFREGCRRGYEDGYYGRTRYGTYSNGAFNLVSGVLQAIINLQRY